MLRGAGKLLEKKSEKFGRKEEERAGMGFGIVRLATREWVRKVLTRPARVLGFVLKPNRTFFILLIINDFEKQNLRALVAK